jgi:heme A synthase
VLSYFHRLRNNRWALAGLGLVAIQVALGFGNIWLAAPGWMQISHLLTAQLLWVTIVAVWLD